ncbi:hypothetical protein Mapa_013008 [Marchantia paleacea]|nr:hypothetical protein Mapa_013008 [Marchantia paleacea]
MKLVTEKTEGIVGVRSLCIKKVAAAAEVENLVYKASSLLGYVGVVLSHRNDEGDDKKTTDDGGKLAPLLRGLLLGLEIGLPLGLLELGPRNVGQSFNCSDQSLGSAAEGLVVLLIHCQDWQILGSHGFQNLVPHGFDERRSSGHGAFLLGGHQQNDPLLVTFLDGRIPLLQHRVREFERVGLGRELPESDHVNVVAFGVLQLLQKPFELGLGDAIQHGGVVHDIAFLGRSEIQDGRLVGKSRGGCQRREL